MSRPLLTIRPETPSDYQAIANVNRLAFGQDNEACLIERIRVSSRFVRDLSLVAEQAGAVVGHILLSYVDLKDEQTEQVLALAPLAVQPEWQMQGIGSQLVVAGLEAAEAIAAVLVVVLGHPRFYSRFGFQPASRYGIEPTFVVPEAAFMVKPLSHYRQHYRGKVIYPPAFDEV